MELFFETNTCYYQVLRHLLCNQNGMTMQELTEQIGNEGFEESLLSIIPKLEDGSWNLFEKDRNLYYSKLHSDFVLPLSDLEKSYLKALLLDARIRLFLNDDQIVALTDMLAAVEPLWTPEQFFYYDRFLEGDHYDDPCYRTNFRTLITAIKSQHFVIIDYLSTKGNRTNHNLLPLRLEYSVKNDKFRLLCMDRQRLLILNVDRMQSVRILDRIQHDPVDLNALIKASYYKEPVTLRIVDKRNALERAMLHFANYEKNTKKIDENTYECLIYYNQSMETELLIEVMSFGPMIKVLGNSAFLEQLTSRLKRQWYLDSMEEPLL